MKILNDGSNSNENRLGAIGSIQFAVEKSKFGDKPLLVIGGDTLFFDDFSVREFYNQAMTSDSDVNVTGKG